MAGQTTRRNGIRPGQVIGFGLVAAILVGIAALVYLRNGTEEETALEEGRQIVQVMRGDLVNQITSSGSIVFPIREELSFGIQGTIGAILVAEGDTVSAGQELARMDEETVVTLERDVAQAEFDLQQSRDALDAALEPAAELALVEARAAIAKAELAVQDANDALHDVEDPFTQEEIDKARADVTSAEEALASAQEDLDFDITEQADKVQAAVDVLDAAREDYQAVVQNYLGQTLTDADYLLTPEEFFSSYGIDLNTFFSDVQLEDAVKSLLPLAPGPVAELDDPATPWDEFTVYRWIALYPGTIYGTCEDINVSPQDVCVLQDMEGPWNKVDVAQGALDTAKNAAAKAESNGAKLVDQAEEAVAVAEEKLEDFLVTVDSLEVQVKLHEREVAKAKLDDARAALEELDEPPDPLTVALREAQITADETAVASAKEALASVTITAPFAGTVSVVAVEEGRGVMANAAILEIVDTTVAEVSARLDEIDVLTVQVGAEAVVTLDGLPGAGLPGVVTSISQTGDNQEGVVTYPIQISVRTPPFLQLREGLSATANIVLQQELDVLLIPTTSIAGSIAEPTVLVSIGDELQERPVTLGASDGFWIVVVSGVDEGDSLVSTGGGGQASQFGNIARFGGLGGLGGSGGLGRGGNLTPEQRQAIRDRIRAGGQGAGAGAGQRGQGAGQGSGQ